MNETLRRVVYVSAATRLFSAAELLDLLAVSRRNNEAAGVTGMLLYRGGNFIQVLEGATAPVEETFKRIGGDRRHKGVIVIVDETGERRQFGDWSMGFQDLSDVDLAAVPGYSDFLAQGNDGEAFGRSPEVALRMLDLFRRDMR